MYPALGIELSHPTGRMSDLGLVCRLDWTSILDPAHVLEQPEWVLCAVWFCSSSSRTVLHGPRAAAVGAVLHSLRVPERLLCAVWPLLNCASYGAPSAAPGHELEKALCLICCLCTSLKTGSTKGWMMWAGSELS